MTELQVMAHCRIKPGQLGAFRAVAADFLECVREKDSGTLQYDWFMSADESLCIVRERYRDSDAVLEHIGNLGELFAAFVDTCDISVEIFGEPSRELLDATAEIPTTVYSFLQGL